MSPTTVYRVELRLFKDSSTSEPWSAPATGGTVTFYRHAGATITSSVEVHEQDVVTVPVTGINGLQVGDFISATGGSDRDFQIRTIGSSSLQLDYLGTSNIVLNSGDRFHATESLQVYGPGGSQANIPSTTIDSAGTVTVWLTEQVFDYEVTGSSAGSAAGFYLSGHAGQVGTIANTPINVGNFPSIQAAIDALPPWGGTVFIPAGLYLLTETLYLPCDRPCHLVGEGRHKESGRGTELRWTTNVGMLRVRGDFSSVRDLVLKNTSTTAVSREDQGYGIAIGRRDVADAHPHPEPFDSTSQTEYERGDRKAFMSVIIENVSILTSAGWGIYIPGFGKLSDESTNETSSGYGGVAPDDSGNEGTLALWVDLKRVHVANSQKFGACFVGRGSTTLTFEHCAFLGQGYSEVPSETYYAYLSACELPVFDRCTFEGLSPSTKAWIRMYGTTSPVFDSCWFENSKPSTATTPTYFLNLVNGCIGGAVRHCRFIRGDNCQHHMSIILIASQGASGLHVLNPGGLSGQEAWSNNDLAYAGPPHIDLGGDSNTGVVISGAGAFLDHTTIRQLQVGNTPRAAVISGRMLGRLTGTTSSELFNPTSDDPARHEAGNLIMNWDIVGNNDGVGAPMYRWGGSATSPQWRLANNAPTLTASQRDARSNWIQGDIILLSDVNGPTVPQIRIGSTWKTFGVS